jgi:hypothetical protein
MENKFRYKIPVGDWSCDGHNRYEYFYVTADKDAKAIELAYAVAKAAYPELDYQSCCEEYEDSKAPEAIAAKCAEVGIELEDGYYGDDTRVFWTDTYIQYAMWFINQGDPELNLQLDDINNVPQLHSLAGGYGLFY